MMTKREQNQKQKRGREREGARVRGSFFRSIAYRVQECAMLLKPMCTTVENYFEESCINMTHFQ